MCALIALLCVSIVRPATQQLHRARAEIEHTRAFYAADAASMVCEQRVIDLLSSGPRPGMLLSTQRMDLNEWPGVAASPFCEIRLITPPTLRPGRYRIDAVGYGVTQDSCVAVRVDLWVAKRAIQTRWSVWPGPVAPPALIDPPDAASAKTRRYRRRRQHVDPARRSDSGLTLIEALLALAIAGVVASYAIPVYHAQTVRAHRSAAALALRRAMLYLEQQRLIEAASPGTVDRRAFDADDSSLPGELASVPSLARRPVYRLRVSVETDQNFTIEAVPVDGEAMASDACGTFTLDSAGHLANTGRLDAQTCWRGR